MNEARLHIPVMVSEVIDFLNPQDEGAYIDVTLGGGGHAEAILRVSSPGGTLLGIDRDGEVVKEAQAHLAEFGKRAVLVQSTFDDVSNVAHENGFAAVDGILADLGVSSMQLDQDERGFSFMREGPLDMRMDRSRGESAADYVARVGEEELANVLFSFGEERFSRRIARAICKEREVRSIETTARLEEIVRRAVPGGRGRIHPATRTFQALRIVVNDELGMLERLLASSYQVLGPGGRMVVISYHSLEDRVVKHTFRAWRDLGGRVLTKKVVMPRDEEVESNPRARSAKLRAFEKSSS